MKTFDILPLAAIVPSLTNPRKHFDAIKLMELAESIRASGVHQPILVRPLPGNRVADTDRGITHEVIAGERRYRASLQAGAQTIPAMICAMDDAQVMEVQLVENLARDDLSALEEAEGYSALMDSSGQDVSAIATKIGKSRSYVFGRLKLLDLGVECKEALRTGAIDASRALLIARIPDTALQTKALAEATRQDFRGEVCSLRALQSWLQANVMLKLESAPFNISDSQLIPAAGACHACPKRTGASPDLFADVQSVDICTDPACYQAKTATHTANLQAMAAKRGMRLISGKEAALICDDMDDELDGYSPLNQVRNDTVDGQPAQLGQLLGDDLPAPVLIENPWTKELVAAVPTDEAEAMLLARGLVQAVPGKATKEMGKEGIEGAIKALDVLMKKETQQRFRTEAFEILADEVHRLRKEDAHSIPPNLLRAWWLREIEERGYEGLHKVFRLDPPKTEGKSPREMIDLQRTQLRLHVQACERSMLYRALRLDMVQDDCPNVFWGELEDPTLLEALAAEVGIDLDTIEGDAGTAVREAHAKELQALRARLKRATADATGYRGPSGETWSGRGLMPRWLRVFVDQGGDKETLRITPAAPAKAPTPGKARKPKTTAAEAQVLIAEALQAQEGEE